MGYSIMHLFCFLLESMSDAELQNALVDITKA